MKDFDTNRHVLEYSEPPAYDYYLRCLQCLTERYPILRVESIGRSVLGRQIPCLRFGEGRRHVLYIGAHHAMEWVTGLVLLRFVNDFCECVRCGDTVGGVQLSYLLGLRSFLVVPILNVDGVQLQLRGPGEPQENPLYERQMRMNGGTADFGTWQANARGVDLNHNYDAGFAEYRCLAAQRGITDGAPRLYCGPMPESEPEVQAVCRLVRGLEICLLLTLHSQGEEIYCGAVPPPFPLLARQLEALSGYRLQVPQDTAAYGGLTDWAAGRMHVPAFTLECGYGKNPLPLSDYHTIYARLRRMFFAAPTL